MAAVAEQPASVVLQPRGCLDQKSSSAFRVELERALHHVTRSVIVDLLWLEAIDPCGLEVLKASVHLAASLNKHLSFQSLHPTFQAVLEREQMELRSQYLGSWAQAWHKDFDCFLSQPARQCLKPAGSDSADEAIASDAAVNISATAAYTLRTA